MEVGGVGAVTVEVCGVVTRVKVSGSCGRDLVLGLVRSAGSCFSGTVIRCLKEAFRTGENLFYGGLIMVGQLRLLTSPPIGELF